jgi:hypothetical protein
MLELTLIKYTTGFLFFMGLRRNKQYNYSDTGSNLYHTYKEIQQLTNRNRNITEIIWQQEELDGGAVSALSVRWLKLSIVRRGQSLEG